MLLYILVLIEILNEKSNIQTFETNVTVPPVQPLLNTDIRSSLLFTSHHIAYLLFSLDMKYYMRAYSSKGTRQAARLGGCVFPLPPLQTVLSPANNYTHTHTHTITTNSDNNDLLIVIYKTIIYV